MVAWAVPPLGLAYLAATLSEAGHDVTVVDGVGEDPSRLTPLDDPRLLRRGLDVDEVAALVPEDSEVIGVSCMFSQEWPITSVPGIVTRIRGEFVHTERRSRIRAIDDIPLPRWDLFPVERYLELKREDLL